FRAAGRLPPCATLFPYTTLFRSGVRYARHLRRLLFATRPGAPTLYEAREGGWTSGRSCATGSITRRSCRRPWPTSRERTSTGARSEEHTSELQSRVDLVCCPLLE